MKPYYYPFILLSALLLTSCATVSKSQCQVGDWQQLGRAAGESGASQRFYHRVAKDCSEYGVRADSAAFEKGRLQGNKRFCTASGGLNAGRRGIEYQSVCSGEAEIDFMRGYLLGRELYLIELEYRDSRRLYDDYYHHYHSCKPGHRCGRYWHHMYHEESRMRDLRLQMRNKEAEAVLKITND